MEPFADLTKILPGPHAPQPPPVIQHAQGATAEHALLYEKFKNAALAYHDGLHPNSSMRPTEEQLGSVVVTSTRVGLAAGNQNPVVDPALTASIQILQQGQAELQQGQSALQQSIDQQQQTLVAVQQGLQVLHAQQFNNSARRRNSVRATAQDDLLLVPLQRELPSANGENGLLGQVPAFFPETIEDAWALTTNGLNQLQDHYGEQFDGSDIDSRRKAFIRFILTD